MKISKVLYFVLLIAWLFLCGHTLVAYLIDYVPEKSGELGVLFGLKMLVLSFPFGYLAGVIGGMLCNLLIKLGMPPLDFLANILVWIAMTITGFFQWFVFVPWIFKKARDQWGKWRHKITSTSQSE